MFTKKTDAEHYANLLKTIVIEGGKLARSMRASADVHEKADKSLVTEADLAVTKLVKDRLAAILKQENHILIDEESADSLPDVETATSGDYQWVLDPIDGTAPYSAGLPFWGVSLGLMKKGQPWLGAVYLPDLDECFWTDGLGRVLHQVTVCGAGKTSQLQKEQSATFTHTPYINELHENYAGGLTPCGYKLTTGSFVCGALQMFKSQAAGFVCRAFIWDNAAILAMAQTLNLHVAYVDGTVVNHLNQTTLQDNWLNNQAILIAHPNNMEFLKQQVLNNTTSIKGK